MNKYTKVKAIGKGNMGTCTLARNNEDGQCYVIKQVDLTRLSKKDRQQSLNEARVLSSLRHPNIINYVDSFLARRSDSLCIVMEFAEGGDLSSRLKKNYGANLPERQVLDWLIQLVLSLHYVHQRKILHRDVKTQNIFLTNEGLIKLGDFGIARTLANTYDQAQTFVGTPYYLSPELILEKPYDHRSDVWALGVVLYEVMSSNHPFNAKDMKGLLHCILAVQYDPLPTVYSAELCNIVTRMLVRKPADRIELTDVLRLPIVRNRLRQWLTDPGAVPEHYVRSLCKHGLLPDEVLTEGGRSGANMPTLVTVGEAAAAAAAAASVDHHRPSASTSTLDQLDPHTPLEEQHRLAGGTHAASNGHPATRPHASSEPPTCVRPYVPPLKSLSPPPLLPSSSPPPLPLPSAPYSPQLPAMHYHLQGGIQPLSTPPALLTPQYPSPSASAASLKLPLTAQERPSCRKRIEASRQPSVSPPPSHISSGRSRKTGRSLVRPYIAQHHLAPAPPYVADRNGPGAAPPNHLLGNPRKHANDVRRAYPTTRLSPVFLNPLYRPPVNPTTPPYSQLAPIPAPTSGIKSMLHRAAMDRARRRQELN
jgi:serine/threonine protein kinase